MEQSQLVRKSPVERTASRLAVHSLTLTDFRNYRSLTLSPDGRNVVLTGANGAGKTNILEAVSLIMPGRGMRSATLSQFQRQPVGAHGWGVAMEVTDQHGDQRQFGTGCPPESPDKRIIRLDGTTLKGNSELSRLFAVLWQTPQMDQLFTEGMSERRRFFDRLVACFSPEHASFSAKYDYLRRERQKLLSGSSSSNHQWIATLEYKMAECSVAMAAERIEAATLLTHAIGMLNPAFPKAVIELQGFAEQALLQGNQSALQIEEQLAALLASSREYDAQSGRASHGAHKMELTVFHADKQMEAAYCSTGEQKVLLLSLLLAQTTAMKQRQQRLPILLLDEVIAHLDETRRLALFTLLHELNVQAWLTGTDAHLFNGFDEQALRCNVSAGTISPTA